MEMSQIHGACERLFRGLNVIDALSHSKKSAGRRFACAAGCGVNEESSLSFNRASQRSGTRAADLPPTDMSFLDGALPRTRLGQRLKKSAGRRFACAAGCGLNDEFERRHSWVGRLRQVWLGVHPALAGIMKLSELIRTCFASGIDR